ncbi:hypothetical protein Cni_G16353 [Canna indica]|uniref:DUF4283 domain-containing protein n=1 Tax=Canna indica TaxID=4628 RepID=A0AAQ3KFX1_9LILI|nr:hypothetical protein Cni_G16353 [Canna indica]
MEAGSSSMDDGSMNGRRSIDGVASRYGDRSRSEVKRSTAMLAPVKLDVVVRKLGNAINTLDNNGRRMAATPMGVQEEIRGDQMAAPSKESERPKSWAGLFRRTMKEDWRFSKELDGKIKRIQELTAGKVVIAEEDIDKARNECRLVLYGKFFGRTSALDLVKSIMPKLWKISGNCKTIDLVAGYFSFKFDEEKDYWNVYTGGPWFLRGQSPSLVQWRENFQPMHENIDVIPVWIQMPGLPPEFMNQAILPQLATVVGKPLKIDDYTKYGDRGKFARICVLLNLKKTIEQGFWLMKTLLTSIISVGELAIKKISINGMKRSRIVVLRREHRMV